MDIKQTKILAMVIGAALLTCSIASVVSFSEKQRVLSSTSASIPFQKGMSFTTWTNSSFNTTATRQEFDEMKSIGVEWVAINHWWYQDYLNSTGIHVGSGSDTFANMTACFLYAKSIGLHVLYKPMLNLAKTYDWRSYIVFTPEWMANYTWWMVENAKAAEAGDVEILCLGTEMGNMQVNSEAVRDMIAQIRAVYSGSLTYSANHDSFAMIDWYDAIDVIGISMYSMMTIAWNPTISDLKTVWNGMYHELEELALKWNKPIAFTEIGIQARDGSSIIPNDNQLSQERDIAEMENYYLSLFQSRIWTAPWFKGAYWWIWDYQDPAINPNLKDFNPILIKDTIKAEYEKVHAVDAPTLPVASATIPLVVGIIMLALVVRKSRSPLLDARFSFNAPGITVTAIATATREEQPAATRQDDILLGIAIGSLFSTAASSLTLNVYDAIQKSFSYAIILGLSTTEILATFAGLLLAGIVIGLVALRFFPRHVLLAAVLLLLFSPFLALGNRYQMLFASTFFDLAIVFLLAAAVAVFSIKCKVQSILRVIFVVAVIMLGFFLLVLAFDKVATTFIAIPVGLAMISGAGKGETGPVPNARGKSNGRHRRAKTGMEMMLPWNALLAGMIIPLGNSIINLVRMNVLVVAMHYIPALVVASGIIAVVAWWQGRKSEGRRFDWTSIFTNRRLMASALLVGLGGFLFIIGGRFMIIWALVSGMYFIQFTGTLVINVRKGITRDNIGGGFAYLAVTTTCFVLGFMLNAIKGLLVYVVTFLTIKDGQIVRRDPAIDPVATFDVPFLLDGMVLAIVVLISAIMLGYYLIARSVKKRRISMVNGAIPAQRP